MEENKTKLRSIIAAKKPSFFVLLPERKKRETHHLEGELGGEITKEKEDPSFVKVFLSFHHQHSRIFLSVLEQKEAPTWILNVSRRFSLLSFSILSFFPCWMEQSSSFLKWFFLSLFFHFVGALYELQLQLLPRQIMTTKVRTNEQENWDFFSFFGPPNIKLITSTTTSCEEKLVNSMKSKKNEAGACLLLLVNHCCVCPSFFYFEKNGSFLDWRSAKKSEKRGGKWRRSFFVQEKYNKWFFCHRLMQRKEGDLSEKNLLPKKNEPKVDDGFDWFFLTSTRRWWWLFFRKEEGKKP